MRNNMTREEVIEELKILKEDYWDDDGYGHETKQYDDTMLALDMAIEALEQESVLDKIRAEIKEHADRLKDSLYGDGMRHCIDIIDNYKAESGDKE